MITISAGQLCATGTVSLVILIAITAVAFRLAETFLPRTITLALALAFLLGCWFQRGAIEQSVRNCDPHVLFIHVKIDDARALAACHAAVRSGVPGTGR